jgi:thiamine-phosphate pyrophosphorylase
MSALDAFYPIVDSAAWIGRLAIAGTRLVQLRMKERADAEIRREIREAMGLCARCGVQLVVNDHWSAAIDEGCDFVHLGQGDLDCADIKSIRAARIRIGVSTHDRLELDRALSIEADYVALGPIYPTTLKAMPWEPQGVANINT